MILSEKIHGAAKHLGLIKPVQVAVSETEVTDRCVSYEDQHKLILCRSTYDRARDERLVLDTQILHELCHFKLAEEHGAHFAQFVFAEGTSEELAKRAYPALAHIDLWVDRVREEYFPGALTRELDEHAHYMQTLKINLAKVSPEHLVAIAMLLTQEQHYDLGNKMHKSLRGQAPVVHQPIKDLRTVYLRMLKAPVADMQTYEATAQAAARILGLKVCVSLGKTQDHWIVEEGL